MEQGVGQLVGQGFDLVGERQLAAHPDPPQRVRAVSIPAAPEQRELDLEAQIKGTLRQPS